MTNNNDNIIEVKDHNSKIMYMITSQFTRTNNVDYQGKKNLTILMIMLVT
jgi:hypothetical protein